MIKVKNKRGKRKVNTGFVVLLAIFVGILSWTYFAYGGLQCIWNQTEWITETFGWATHPFGSSGRSDWTQYHDQTDSSISSTLDYKIELVPTPATIHYPDAQGGANDYQLLSGPGHETNATVITGTGANERIEFHPQIENIFAGDSLQTMIVGTSEAPQLAVGKPMVRVGDYIYAFFTHARFGRFDINTQEWEYLEDSPGVVGVGSCLAHPQAGAGYDQYIYALQGGGATGFWRYNIPGAGGTPDGEWVSLSGTYGSDSNIAVSYGGSLVAGTETLYCLPGGDGNGISGLNLNYLSDGWYAVTITGGSISAVRYGSMVLNTNANTIYIAPGKSSDAGAFYILSIVSDDQLQMLTSTTAYSGFESGVDLYWPGFGSYIYAFYGSDGQYFARYSTAYGWEELTRPFNYNFQTWNGGYRRGLLFGEETAGPGGDGELYLLSPTNINKIYTYDLASTLPAPDGKWVDFVVAAPAIMYRAVQVVRGTGIYSNYLYIASQSNFWSYYIPANKWEVLSSLPVSTDGSQQMVSMRHQDGAGGPTKDFIYYAPGGTETSGGDRFYRYELGSIGWTPLDDGSVLPNISVYPALGKDDTYIYYISGYEEYDYGPSPGHVYRYEPVAGTWSQLNDHNGSGVGGDGKGTCGWNVSMVNANGTVYSTAGPYKHSLTSKYSQYNKHLYKYNSVSDTWEATSDFPYSNGGYLHSSSLSYSSSDPDYIYVRGFSGRGYWYNLARIFMRYHIVNDTWEILSLPPTDTTYVARADHDEPWVGDGRLGIQGGVFVGDKGYFAVARSDTFVTYDIGDGAWEDFSDQIYTNLPEGISYTTNWQDTTLYSNHKFYNYFQDRHWVDNVYVPEEGVIYQFCAPVASHGWTINRFDVAGNKWLEPMKSPFPISPRSTRAVYSNGKIYVSRGEETKNLWVYNVSPPGWTDLGDKIPFITSVSAAMCSNGLAGTDERIFIFSGDYVVNRSGPAKVTVFKPNDAGGLGRWTSVVNSQRNSERGTSSVVVGDNVYVLFGWETPANALWSFSLSGNSWNSHTEAEPPFNPANTNMCYVAEDEGIYVVSASHNMLYRYNVSGAKANSWDTICPLPFFTGTDCAVLYPGLAGKEDFLYIYPGDRSGSFWVYSRSNNEFSEIKYLPVRADIDSTVAAAGNKTYYLKDGMYSYDPTNNLWSNLPGSINTEYYPSMVYAGAGYPDRLYLTRGYSSSYPYLYYYSLGESALYTAPGSYLKGSESIGYYGYGGSTMVSDGEYVYLTRGHDQQRISRYDMSTTTGSGSNDDGWERLADVPEKVYYGSDMVYYEPDDLIFILPGKGSKHFFAFDIAKKLWTQDLTANPWSPADFPMGVGSTFEVGSSVSLVYPGRGIYIYAFTSGAGEGNQVFRYNVSTNSWTDYGDIEALPRGLQARAKAVYPGTGDYFYIFPGRWSMNIYPYLAFATGSYISPIKNIGINSGFGATGWTIDTDHTDLDNVTVKMRTSNDRDMLGAVPFSGCSSLRKDISLTEYSYPSVTDTEKYVQWWVDFITYDAAAVTAPDKPALTGFDFDFSRYPQEGAVVSSPYNTTFENNRILDLSWDWTEREGTNLRFQLRTGGDLTELLSAEWQGPDETYKEEYNFDTFTADTYYEYASEIEFVNDKVQLKKIGIDYAYHQDVIVDNRLNANILYDYPVKIVIDSSNGHFWENVKSDGSDIRFSDYTKELSYGFEKFNYNDRYAVIWVKVSQIEGSSQKQLLLYYDYPDAEPVDDFTEVFDFFDDFDGPGFSETNWQTPVGMGGNVMFKNVDSRTVVELDGTRSNTPMDWYIMTNDLFDTTGGMALETSEKRDGGVYVTWFDTQMFNNNEYFGGSGGRNNSAASSYKLYNSFLAVKEEQVSPYNYVNGDWATRSIIREGDDLKSILLFHENFPLELSLTPNAGLIDQGYIRLVSYVCHRSYFLDWIRLRKYSSPEPTTKVGPVVWEEPGTPLDVGGVAVKYRQAIRIKNNSFTEAFNNHVVEVVVGENNTHFWDNIGYGGRAVRFTNQAAGTIYYHWEKEYDLTNKRATYLVKVPSLPADSEQIMYLYYDAWGPGQITDGSDPYNTFDSFEDFSSSTNFYYTPGFGVVTFGSYGKIEKYVSDELDHDWEVYLTDKDTFAHEKNLTFYCLFNQYEKGSGYESVQDYIGFKDGSAAYTNNSYNDMTYGFHFDIASWYYDRYLYAVRKGSLGPKYTFAPSKGATQNWYEVKIVLTDTGAKYYARQLGEREWRITYQYNPFDGTPATVRPYLVHRSSIDTQSEAYTDNWIVYKEAPDDVKLFFDYQEDTVVIDRYHSINPTLQPIRGVFYKDGLLDHFSNSLDNISVPLRDIQYQISNNGWEWYYFNGSSWVEATDGYTGGHVNSANTIDSNLAGFMSIFPEGIFYYRAYLHSGAAIGSPQLDDITVTFKGGASDPSWYVDSTGLSEDINPDQHDSGYPTPGDQWFQYKAILYSDGEFTPTLNEVNMKYINPEIKNIKVTLDEPGIQPSDIFVVSEHCYVHWDTEGLEDVSAKTYTLAYSIDGVNGLYSDCDLSSSNNVPDLSDGGYFDWILPNTPSSDVYVKVTSNSHPTVEETFGPLRIMSLEIEDPDKIVDWEEDSDHIIDWNSKGEISNGKATFHLSYDAVGGVAWPNYESGWQITSFSGINPVEHIGQFLFRVEHEYDGLHYYAVSDYTCKIVAVDDNKDFLDESDYVFRIVPKPDIEMLVPEPGGTDEWVAGKVQTIEWINIGYLSHDLEIRWNDIEHGTQNSEPINWANVTMVAVELPYKYHCSYDFNLPNQSSSSVELWIAEKSVPTYTDIQSGVFYTHHPIRSEQGTPDSILVGDHWTWSQADEDDPEIRNFMRTVQPGEFMLKKPSVVISAPTGEEPITKWVIGDSRDITWTVTGALTYPVRLDYSINGSAFPDIDTGDPANIIKLLTKPTSDTYSWKVDFSGEPILVENSVNIRITDDRGTTFTDSVTAESGIFKVYDKPQVILTTPPNLAHGEFYDIEWEWVGLDSRNDLSLQLYDGNNSEWKMVGKYKIAANQDGIEGSLNTFHWDVPDPTAIGQMDATIIRIYQAPPDLSDFVYHTNDSTDSLVSAGLIVDESDIFSIVYPTILIAAPAQSELTIAGTYDIEITKEGIVATEVSEVQYAIGEVAPSPESAEWITTGTSQTSFPDVDHPPYVCTWGPVPDYPDEKIHIRIVDISRPIEPDGSPQVCSEPVSFDLITPEITNITSGGVLLTELAQAWILGQDYYLEWTTTGGEVGAINSLEIQCGKGPEGPWDDIPTIATIIDADTLVSNAGVLVSPWTADIPDPPWDTAHIRIHDPARDGSSVPTEFVVGPFEIADAYIEFITPQEDDTDKNWQIAQDPPRNVEWNAVGNITYPIKLYFTSQYADLTTIWELVDDNIDAGSDFYPLALDCDPSATYGARIRVVDSYDPPREFVSAAFTIILPKFAIDSPIGFWSATATETITWHTDFNLDVLSGPLQLEWSASGFPVGPYDAADPHVIVSGLAKDVEDFEWVNIPELAVAEGPTIRLRVIDTGRPEINGVSNPFNIYPLPVITILSPEPGDVWRIGEPDHRIEWIDNGGNISNSLTFRLSTDDSVTQNWYLIDDGVNPEFDLMKGVYFYDWVIPHDLRINPADNCYIEIRDNSAWRTVGITPEYCTSLSSQFEVALTEISLWSPPSIERKEYEIYWAWGEKPRIEWDKSGYLTDVGFNLMFTVGGVEADGIDIGLPNSQRIFDDDDWANGELSSGVPNSLLGSNIQIKIVDAGGYYNGTETLEVAGLSDTFTVIQKPEIIIDNGAITAQPFYLVGVDNVPINWTAKGVSIENVKIEQSPTNFVIPPGGTPTDYIREIEAGVENTPNVGGSYTWVTSEDTSFSGSAIRLRLSMIGRPDVFVISDPFIIQGGFDITRPVDGDKRFVVGNDENLTWNTKGGILQVNLRLELEPVGTTPLGLALESETWPLMAEAVANEESFTYEIKYDDLTDLQKEQLLEGPIATARIRIEDASDPTNVFAVSEPFDVDYYNIRWRILDADYLDTPLNELKITDNAGPFWESWPEAAEPGVVEHDYTGYIPHRYPSRYYQTTWGRQGYLDTPVEWSADGDKTIVAELQNATTALLEWRVIFSTSYIASETDVFQVSTWLQRKGGLVNPELLDSAIVEVYNDEGLVLSSELNEAPDEQGVFWFDWEGEDLLEPGQAYFIQCAIVYRGKEYNSGSSISVTAEVQLDTIENEIEASRASIETKVDSAQEAIETVIETEVGEARIAIEDKVDAAQRETAEILVAAEKTIIAEVTETRDRVETSMKARILNRESTVKRGNELTVRYRTHANVIPTIDVYDSHNILRVNKGIMEKIDAKKLVTASDTISVESITEGVSVYSYTVLFDSRWDTGDFTIVCSETTKGTIDALIISVLRSDIESVAGQVSAIMGGISKMDDVEDAMLGLTAQFGMIERALQNIGYQITSEVTTSKKSQFQLEEVYSNLISMSSQIKKLSIDSSIDLEKIYNVSADKSKDLTYLKNKTQELKAVMDLNQRLIQGIANKQPVSQTWYEYK